jgi:dTDP-4-amino-4,6-dideoxygalactose transaminase
VFVRQELLRPGWDRDRILQAINAEGVPCLVGSCSEVYREKAFVKDRRRGTRLPVVKELGETSLMFLVHPTLKIEAIDQACSVIERVMASATSQAPASSAIGAAATL